MKITLFIIINIVCCSVLLAQSDSTNTQGEIVSGQVVIEKDKKIVMPQADKIFLRTTPESFTNQPMDLKFLSVKPSFEWPDYKSDVPFKSLDEAYPLEDFQNYIRLGFGNYSSPLAEIGLFRKVGSFDTKAKLFYESFNGGPVNDENSATSTGGIDISATYQKENLSITPSINYRTNGYSFFGNGNRVNNGFPDLTVEDVLLNDFLLKVDLSRRKEDFSYSISPYVNYVNQNLQSSEGLNKETVIGTSGKLQYKIDDAFVTGLEVELNNASYNGGVQLDRSLVNAQPWIRHSGNDLSIKAGFMISSANVGDNTETGFYPSARLDYDLSDKWSVFGVVSGGQSWIGFEDLIEQNQFLDDSLTIVPEEHKISIGGGLKGSPAKNLLMELDLTYNSIEGLPFFVASSEDSSRFILDYDSDAVELIRLRSSLSYMPTAVSTYGLSLEINGYSLESLDRPWHKPAYIIRAHTSHNIKEKLVVSTYLTSMGGIRGPANVDFGYVRLPAFTDLGLGVNYLITKRASAFISVNNLLNNEYERYLGYPTRGITFKLGGQYRF